MSKNKNIPQKKKLISTDSKWMWPVLIAVVSIIAYSQIFKADFTNWDDPKYIDENPLIMNFGWESIKQIFSGFYMGHYHPLTMISIAFDHLIFSNNATGYHITNLILHIFNSILVFLIIDKLFEDKKIPLISSLLFAVHPMHVESVAWISERKDVLFSFFFLLSLLIYIRYQTQNGIKWFALSLLFFVLGCLSKSAAITLPFCLIGIDYLKGKSLKDPKIYFGKIPFLIFSVLFGILSVYANKPLDADTESVIFRWGDRILYSAYGLVLYLFKLAVPVRLSAWYPYPTGQYFYYFASVSVLIILLLAYILFKRYRNNRIILFSAFFFMVNIVLVLQIFPARSTVIADRYTYIPSIGFFLLIAYFYGQYFQNAKKKSLTRTTLLIIYMAVMMMLTFNRSAVWKNSLSLWENVLRKYPEVTVALNNHGLAKTDAGEYRDAINDFDKLIKLKPDYSDAFVNRGFALERSLDTNGAMQDYSRAIELDRNNILAYSNRAMLWSDLNDSVQALLDINYALQLKSDVAMLWRNKGLILIKSKNYSDGLKYLNTAIELNRNYSMAYENRGFVKHQTGNFKGALDDYNTAIKLSPKSADTYFNRAATWFKLGRNNNACKDLKKSSELGNQQAAELYKQYCGS
jgi:tetratricopeptide (TPR) repeat protein